MTQTEAGPGAFPAVDHGAGTRNIWEDEAKVELVAYASRSNQIKEKTKKLWRSTDNCFLPASWEPRGLEKAAYVSVIHLQSSFYVHRLTPQFMTVYQLASGFRGKESRSRTRS